MAILRTVEELEAIYGRPKGGAVYKEIGFLSEHYRAFVEAAPFVVLASAGPAGLDCSPKGDAPGFVRVLDEHTLAIPDRPGNNRIDNLRNIIADPRVALLFIIPGVGETLRINGRAEISNDSDLLQSFAVEGKLPRTVIVVTIEAAYVHCSKALIRSKLWDPSRHLERAKLPSLGEMLAPLSGNTIDASTYDRDLPERLKATLY
jgi:PPOX class probable FMN-dependent enzyme